MYSVKTSLIFEKLKSGCNISGVYPFAPLYNNDGIYFLFFELVAETYNLFYAEAQNTYYFFPRA